MEESDLSIISRCFSKVYAKKAALSHRVYGELFEQIPFSKEVMQSTATLQKEGFVSVLIELMRHPQTGLDAQVRMDGLREMHFEMNVTKVQIHKTKTIIISALQDELATDLTATELGAWERSIEHFAQQLAVGLS